jgi:hypothetical protein
MRRAFVGGFLCLWTTLTFAATVPSGQDMRFKDVADLVQQQHLKTIEDSLPLLTQKFPEYFKFNTLMYNSLSLQESTFTDPRVIVFGPEAKFILTFNGDANKRAGGTFETVEYDSQNHQFLFREIEFKYPTYDPAQLDLDPSEIAYQDANIVISNPNPQKCTQCHGQNPSPIWATYFVWAGAYGSDDDDLTLSFDKAGWNPNDEDFFKASTRPQSMGRQIVFKPGFADEELNGMVQFLQGKPQHPRYKWLPTAFAEPGLLKYAQGEVLANLDYSQAADAERKRVNASYEWPSRPNLFFQTLLMNLNQERIIYRLGQAGLKQNSLASAEWLHLVQFETTLKGGSTAIRELAGEIAFDLAAFPFDGNRPDSGQIGRQLKQNFVDEIQNVIEKMTLEQSSFAPNSLAWFPYPGDTSPPTRYGLDYLGDPVAYYTDLLGLTTFSEVDNISVHLETDDIAAVTMLNYLLLDKGIDLHDFSMNLRHASLSFHDGGLIQVGNYLGLTNQL